MTRPHRRKVLFLSTRYPSNLGNGSPLRAAAVLRMLVLRHDVHLIVLCETSYVRGPFDPVLETLCQNILYLRMSAFPDRGEMPESFRAQGGFVPSQMTVVSHSTEAAAILRYYQEHEIDLLFVFKLESVAPITSTLRSFPRRYLDLDEVPSFREEVVHQIKTRRDDPAEEALDVRRLTNMRRLERLLIPQFHRVYVSSNDEVARARDWIGFSRALLLPNICPPKPFLPYQPQENPREILFVGSLNLFPNCDAIHYFCREIYPFIRQAKGESVSFRICGLSCPASIQSLHGRDGVQVSGYVPDLTPYYARASLVVVPLRAGGGTRLKILEAFAYGRPVVSTTIGAEGLEVTSGIDCLIADTPESFAAACLKLLDQPALAGELAKGGLKLNRERYSEEALLQAYDQAERLATTDGPDVIPP